MGRQSSGKKRNFKLNVGRAPIEKNGFRWEGMDDVSAITVQKDHEWFEMNPVAREMIRRFVPGEATYTRYKPTHMMVVKASSSVYHRFQEIMDLDEVYNLGDDERVDMTEHAIYYSRTDVRGILLRDTEYFISHFGSAEPDLYMSECSEVVGFADYTPKGEPVKKEIEKEFEKFLEGRTIK